MTQSLTMYQVDAFTDRPFAGNPAAVLILDRPLDARLMQAIATENNLAETAFVLREGAGFSIRWFTPTNEVSFCGHATLASAHVLATALGETGQMSFRTAQVGTLSVTRKVDGSYALDLPRLDPVAFDPPPALSQILPVGWRAAVRNFENYFIELDNAQAVAGFVPDLPAIAAFGQFGLCITAAGGQTHQGQPVDFTSRYFCPGGGINEDPVTGSTHATLVPYWANRLGKVQMTAFQASQRGGVIGCELTADRVILTGCAITFMKATIYPG